MTIPLDIVGYQRPRYIYILENPHRIFMQSPEPWKGSKSEFLSSSWTSGGSTFMVGQVIVKSYPDTTKFDSNRGLNVFRVTDIDIYAWIKSKSL